MLQICRLLIFFCLNLCLLGLVSVLALELMSLPCSAVSGSEQAKSYCLSQSATYSVSSTYPGYEKKSCLLTGAEDLHTARLLSNQVIAPEFAFHTELQDHPNIVIDLGRSCLIDGLVIENRRRQLQERAQGLTVLVSTNKADWRQIKAFTKTPDVWNIKLSEPVEARYVKLELAATSYFHLAHVSVNGRDREDDSALDIVAQKSPLPTVSKQVTAADIEKSIATDRPIRDKWALVIGINDFEDPRIPHLQYAAKDATDFANFLTTYGNFAKDHVVLLTNENATEHEIRRIIGDDWLPRRVMEDDVILIYASTHGSPKELDVAGQNFLILHDTNVDNLFSTAIELEDLARTIRRRTQCDRVLLVLDSCNSGAAAVNGGKGLIRTNNFDLGSIAGEGTIVISSSGAGQRSWESKRYKNGVFTHGLIESLKCNGQQTKLSDAFNALKDSVEQEVRFDRKAEQTPVMKMTWNGKEMAILAPPTRPRKTEPYVPIGTKKAN